MGEPQQVDYDALAKQHGALSSVPVPVATGAVDYDALAKQHGAINSQAPTGDKTFWQKVKDELTSDELIKQSKPIVAGEPHPLPGSTEGAGLREGLAGYVEGSAGEVAGGAKDIAQGNIARGAHRVIQGAGAGVAPMAAMTLPAVAAAAPVATALSIGGGMAGQKVAQSGAEMLGATPDQAAVAGDIGGIVGGIAGSELSKLGGKALLLGKTPQEAYQSALKPSTTMRPSKVARIVDTGLQQEIPVSKGGQEKLASLIEDLDDKVTAAIGGGKGRTIDPQVVAQRAEDLKPQFAKQVNPDTDLQAIDASKQEFLKNNPSPIPAADAQAMKVGTYRQLKDKAYGGELKSATIESQKALARGLKEELANVFPELNSLNAELSKAYDLQPVLEKAVQRQGNHQILGIGTPIATGTAKAVTGSSKVAAVVGALKAVVDNPIVKSRLAIALNKAGVPWATAQSRIQAYSGALAGAVSGASSATPDGQNNSPTN